MTPRGQGRTCAYCGEATLSGDERPEHVVPAALRAGFVVYSVCDPCNEWAGKHVDQPFLDDAFIRIHRAEHDLRDPRHPDRRVPHPLGHGFTAEGVEIRVDADWVPRMRGRIIEDAASGEVRIVAADEEELARLTDRVIRRAAAQGKTAEIGEPSRTSGHPEVRGALRVRPWVWRREVAKIALATASQVYPEDWRVSADAALLRHWMRDKEALPFDHCPVRTAEGTAYAQLVQPPSHALLFLRAPSATVLVVVLFGTPVFVVPVDTAGRGVPASAWLLDTAKPRDPGATSRDRLIMEAVAMPGA